ncbi:TPR-like protein [Thozetella sp. PMI_491]|nr:TPR-like protein [Thozetella sp. PMI_491]
MLFIGKECEKVAVVGPGGIGKTQVALQLAYWARDYDCQPKFSVFWVSALSIPSFQQSYSEIAQKLQIRMSDKDEDPKELIHRYLSSKAAGPWLLIIDNADDKDILFSNGPEGIGGMARYLPTSESGLTLFTTRSRYVASTFAGADMVELYKTSLQEAKAELLDNLQCLPLAITQAAAYINVDQVSVKRYLRLLQGTEKDAASLISREFGDNTRYPESHNAVANTLLVSFDQIHKNDTGATELLSFISRVEPKAIPRSMLPSLGSEEQVAHAIGTLRGYAFLTERGDGEMYDMHSLVHLVSRIWAKRHGLEEKAAEDTIQHLARIFPSSDYSNRPTWRQYLPHALRVLRQDETANPEERSNLCLSVGVCLDEDGREREAVELLEECYRWRSTHLAKEDSARLMSQHELAIVYERNGRVKEAIELLEYVVVAVRKTVLSEKHPGLLASQHTLGMAYLTNGQVKETIELLEYVVAVRKIVLSEKHPGLLASQHTLGMAYHTNGQVKEAIKLLEYIVTVRKTVLSKNHPDLLKSQHTLGMAYHANGQVKEAIELLEYVVIVRKTILSKNHPDLLVSQHELARAYIAGGQVDKGIELLEHVVRVEETVLAENHPYRLASQHELARACIARG